MTMQENTDTRSGTEVHVSGDQNCDQSIRREKPLHGPLGLTATADDLFSGQAGKLRGYQEMAC